MAKILIVDDEENIRESLKSALDKRGHETVTAENAVKARDFFSAGFDLILMDVLLPDGNGVELLREILKSNPRQSVVMISGHADIDTAVSAIRLGAHDFIEKPLSLDRILVTIDNAARTGRLVSEKNRLRSLLYGDLVGDSEAIQKLRADISRSAAKTDKFLILGENGTGKELVANMIHTQCRNGDGPFVAVNCAALPGELVESELFGHARGAFTGATGSRKGKFQEADSGTIFLDEISEMPPEAQAKILRVLETRHVTPVGSDKERQVDVIVVAASNRDLEKLSAEGKFRQDLYYRLNVVSFVLPPLRERPDDIPLLARHFLSRFANETGAVSKSLTEGALSMLAAFDFPGNVRELKNMMERVNIYCDSTQITADDLRTLMPAAPIMAGSKTLKSAVDSFEKEHIRMALLSNGGNVAVTARQLGLERSHLYKKMKKLGMG